MGNQQQLRRMRTWAGMFKFEISNSVHATRRRGVFTLQGHGPRRRGLRHRHRDVTAIELRCVLTWMRNRGNRWRRPYGGDWMCDAPQIATWMSWKCCNNPSSKRITFPEFTSCESWILTCLDSKPIFKSSWNFKSTVITNNYLVSQSPHPQLRLNTNNENDLNGFGAISSLLYLITNEHIHWPLRERRGLERNEARKRENPAISKTKLCLNIYLPWIDCNSTVEYNSSKPIRRKSSNKWSQLVMAWLTAGPGDIPSKLKPD